MARISMYDWIRRLRREGWYETDVKCPICGANVWVKPTGSFEFKSPRTLLVGVEQVCATPECTYNPIHWYPVEISS